VALGQVSIGYGQMVIVHNSRGRSLGILLVGTLLSQVGACMEFFWLWLGKRLA